MASVAATRTALYEALDAALTDNRVRVSRTPYKTGTKSRYDALVVIGSMVTSGDVAQVDGELELQVGIGTSIEDAYDELDTQMQAIVDALPIWVEEPEWSTVSPDLDDQPLIRSVAALRMHPQDVAIGDDLLIVAGSKLLINATDAVDIN